jgi:23S rRNA pseudouridine1911/1915/1917 synthase
MHTQIDLDRGDIGLRIDRVLQRHLSHVPGVTRNRLQGLIAAGAVHLNGRIVARASARVAAGDMVSVELPDRPRRVEPAAEDLPIDVRYEDDALLIANKPAGQVAHPAFRNATGTLLNALLARAAGRWQPSLISRLDKGTSGLLLVAKSREVHAAMQLLSNHNQIEKDYLALVAGRAPARGTIDLALDRDPWDKRRVTVRDRGGVPSVTRFERLRAIAIAPERYVSLVRCRLVTGRMHQIRVHLAAKGWPILGDPVYGATRDGSAGRPGLWRIGEAEGRLSLNRQALHAWRLAFPHPVTGTRIDVTAPIPTDLQQLLDELFTAAPAAGPHHSSSPARSSSTVPSAE